jgi:NADH dehydrogenase FAD-containing subunit
MGKHLVLAGGGHAHLTSLKNLSEFKNLGHRVTLVSSSPYHYYSGMGPGMLSGLYHPRQLRFHVRKMAEDRGASFIQGRALKVDPRQRLLFLESGEKIEYDVLSFNTGSEVPIESLTKAAESNIFPVKPIIHLLRARQTILEEIKKGKLFRLAVIGGGPAGVEISASLLRLFHENRGEGKITLIGGKRLLAGAPEKARRLAKESLTRRGVEIIEGSHVKAVEKREVLISDGKRLDIDLIFVAIGIRPSALFSNSGIPTGTDGGMLVNSRLQSVAYPEIFGGGDCISLEGESLAKVGVYAVRENPILFHNLRAALEGGRMEVFRPQKDFLLIFNMGDGRGIFWKKNWVWEGKLALFFKDYIDRKFMKAYQVSGELDEMSENVG